MPWNGQQLIVSEYKNKLFYRMVKKKTHRYIIIAKSGEKAIKMAEADLLKLINYSKEKQLIARKKLKLWSVVATDLWCGEFHFVM